LKHAAIALLTAKYLTLSRTSPEHNHIFHVMMMIITVLQISLLAVVFHMNCNCLVFILYCRFLCSGREPLGDSEA